jgi:hypothetical protein
MASVISTLIARALGPARRPASSRSVPAPHAISNTVSPATIGGNAMRVRYSGERGCAFRRQSRQLRCIRGTAMEMESPFGIGGNANKFWAPLNAASGCRDRLDKQWPVSSAFNVKQRSGLPGQTPVFVYILHQDLVSPPPIGSRPIASRAAPIFHALPKFPTSRV